MVVGLLVLWGGGGEAVGLDPLCSPGVAEGGGRCLDAWFSQEGGGGSWRVWLGLVTSLTSTRCSTSEPSHLPARSAWRPRLRVSSSSGAVGSEGLAFCVC